jgi:hypothetical protein
MLASSFIGFVAGIALTALFISFGTHPAHHKASPTPAVPTVVPVSANAISSRLRALAESSLGFAPDTGRPRVEAIYVSTATPRLGVQNGLPQLFDATIVFHLNANPFGKQVASAKADTVALLKSLYAHSLPLNEVNLEGMFVVQKRKHEVIALQAGSNVAIQNALAPWKKLTRSDEKRVWAALRPHFVSAAFQKYKYTRG